jgi:hypothetical protein
MTLGEEHIPKTQFAGLLLQVLNDRWVTFPAGITLASKGFYHRVGTMYG